MDVRKEFAPTGANKGLVFLSAIGMLKVENAFKECALELDYLIPACPQKTAALELLLQAKKACTTPEAVVQATNDVPAQAQVQSEPNKEEQNVEEKKPVQKGRTSRKK